MNVLQSYLGGKAARFQKDNPGMQMPMPGMPQGGQGNPMGAYAQSDATDVGNRMMGDLQRDFGLTPAQAAGFVGNLAHESGDFKTLQEINPMVEGSRGGYGYAQWTGPRRKAFEQWTAANGLDPTSYEANYGFLKHELTATPEGAVIGQLRSTKTPDEAAQVVSDTFLRPGIPNMGSRVSRARSYYGNPMTEFAGQP